MSPINTDTHTGPSFSLQNRLARLIWNYVYLVLFRYSPVPFHGWRRLLLRFFGARIGKGVHVYPGVKIWAPWNLTIQDYTGIAGGVILYSQGKIFIGKKTVISQYAHICTGTHDYTKEGFPLITKPVHIGDQVWIAAEVFVHPGVIIGNGAVVGARSVVTQTLPEWQVCSGHPCVPLKRRVLLSS